MLEKRDLGCEIVKRTLNEESASKTCSAMSNDMMEVYRDTLGLPGVSGGIFFSFFFFSVGKGKGGNTHTQSGRTGRSLPGEEHHQPRQRQVQKLPWCLGQTENSSLSQEHRVWEAVSREEGVGLDPDQVPVSLQLMWIYPAVPSGLIQLALG